MSRSPARAVRVLPLLALLAMAGPASAQTPPPKPKPKTPAKTAPAGAAPTPAATPAPTPPPPPTPPSPPAWNEPPSTSYAGTQLVPVGAEPAPLVTVAVAAPAPASPDIERRVAALEAQLDAANSLLKEYEGELRWLRMFKIGGYLQPQLLFQFYNASASPNASGGSLPAGIGPNDTTAVSVGALNGVGSTTNGDFFRLRRARLKIEFAPVDSARLVFEIDPTPAGGPVSGATGTIAREVEAIGIARWTPHIETEFGMGIFKIPFGWEVLQSDADRPFIERSWGERNLTPGEFDTGIRAYSRFFDDRLKFQAAVINGNMEGEKSFSILPDLNKGKDLVGRLNYDFGPVDVGVSGYYGQGQLVDPTMLAFKQYPRGAGNFELHLHSTLAPVLGETKFFAEGTIATNMDRGVNYGAGTGLPALPTMVATQDVTSLHEVSLWARVEQDLTRWVTLGLRFDYYNPNDTVCAQSSACSSVKSARATYAAVGAVHFTRWLQLMLEYDHAIDNVHTASTPAPSKVIDSISSVLQVRF